MIWITLDDVVRIHGRILQATGGLDGIRDMSILESAIAAPLQTFDGEDLFPGTIEKIARLGYGLTRNHAFIDGNKRVGALSVQLLLEWNGYNLVLKPGELSNMFISIADGTANENDLLQWIQNHL